MNYVMPIAMFDEVSVEEEMMNAIEASMYEDQREEGDTNGMEI